VGLNDEVIHRDSQRKKGEPKKERTAAAFYSVTTK
jgi:hypothetical protein